MKKVFCLAVATFANVVLLGGPVLAQGTPQTVSLVKVDLKTLATGYRTSKVVGSTVVNEANETVGKVDDLIVTRDSKVPFAVLSVGGFLGLGNHLVAVPFDSFRLTDTAMDLPGASKDALKALPEFEYASR
jgi:PRC-barrel domain protein